MDKTLAELAAIADPVERFKAATETVELARTKLMAGARQVRQEAVNELRSQGMSYADVAAALGQSRSRVQQISEGRTGGKAKPAE